ncbi:helix-turn-helix transcriptional regulator [Streptococcus suis]|uniref:helix-turn-helix transcriptional regulator n=1 Tax=Streptococcus suis TaxID=1307 RepID=UPI00093B21B6|nr:helix-turn-helix transcriptional regulator [Streptococcus suis]MBO4127852.1 helix-turn-helix transcriptional regulator [Streptococcus suis]WFA76044.1 helix-turn-helix transcriptional regulator [Streptococcus suis]
MTKQAPNRVRELRKNARLTQQELADKLGVMRKTVSNWETGSCLISPKHANSLATFFNVSLGYLLGVISDDKARSDFSHYVVYSTRK